MEESVAEEAEARNQKKKEKRSIQIVKLEFIEVESGETKNINPIPG